jgi:hypothetical protein
MLELPGIIGFKELLEFDRGGFLIEAVDKDGIIVLFLQLIRPMDMDFLTKDDSSVHSMQCLFGTSSFMEFNQSRLI